MSKNIFRVLRDARFWGSSPIQASRETPAERNLEVFRSSTEGQELVGRLSLEDGTFVFRYAEEYRGEPILAFPRIEKNPERTRLFANRVRHSVDSCV